MLNTYTHRSISKYKLHFWSLLKESVLKIISFVQFLAVAMTSLISSSLPLKSRTGGSVVVGTGVVVVVEVVVVVVVVVEVVLEDVVVDEVVVFGGVDGDFVGRGWVVVVFLVVAAVNGGCGGGGTFVVDKVTISTELPLCDCSFDVFPLTRTPK